MGEVKTRSINRVSLFIATACQLTVEACFISHIIYVLPNDGRFYHMHLVNTKKKNRKLIL